MIEADHAADDGDVLGRLRLQVDVGLRRGLVPAGIDHDQLEAALLGVVQPLPRIGLRQSGGDRDQRVRADDHAHVGGGRTLVQGHPDAHEALRDRLAGLVDRRGDPPTRVADRLAERVRQRRGERVGETEGAAVERHGQRSVLVDDAGRATPRSRPSPPPTRSARTCRRAVGPGTAAGGRGARASPATPGP